MKKKCKTGKFWHGGCENQDAGVGGVNADLVVLLLLPFNSLHEPVAQNWMPVEFLT
jgi:hypothetical protein